MAVNMALTHKAKLLFVYVLEPLIPERMSTAYVYFPPTLLDESNIQDITEIKGKIQKRMIEFCQKEPDIDALPGGGPEYHIIEGAPAASIVKTAEKMHADLIVMGSHTHGVLDTLLVGSVANKVVNHSTKPVFLVPVKRN